MIQIQNLNWGRVNVQLNILGARFNSGPLNRDTVELVKRIAIAIFVLIYPLPILIGLGLGSLIVLTGAVTSTQARAVFNSIYNAGALPQLGIAIACYFYTATVIVAGSALIGGIAMNRDY